MSATLSYNAYAQYDVAKEDALAKARLLLLKRARPGFSTSQSRNRHDRSRYRGGGPRRRLRV